MKLGALVWTHLRSHLHVIIDSLPFPAHILSVSYEGPPPIDLYLSQHAAQTIEEDHLCTATRKAALRAVGHYNQGRKSGLNSAA